MSQHCLGYKVTGDTAGSAWRWGVLQVQKASPSPSLSRWRRWEEPCGCWATRTERLVVLQPEHFSFFRQGFVQRFPVFFAMVLLASFPLSLQRFRRVFYYNGWLVVVVVV